MNGMNSLITNGARRRFGKFSGFTRTLMWLAVIGAALNVSAARADDDDDRSADQRILGKLLNNLGLRNDSGGDIDYRERSPLVVPPAANLPAPEQQTTRTANWPKDPDVRRAKEAARAARAPSKSLEEEGRPLTPAELNRGHRPGARSNDGSPGPGDPLNPMLSPAQLGAKGIGSMFSGFKEEKATFTKEPDRNSLTQPPPGYQTPSPNFAYGVGPPKPVQSQVDDSRPLPPGKY